MNISSIDTANGVVRIWCQQCCNHAAEEDFREVAKRNKDLRDVTVYGNQLVLEAKERTSIYSEEQLKRIARNFMRALKAHLEKCPEDISWYTICNEPQEAAASHSAIPTWDSAP